MSRTVWMVMLGLVACGGGEAPPAPAPEPVAEEAPAEEAEVAKDSPEGLAKTANAIAKDPSKADQILKAEGWTMDDYQAALVDAASDPAKAAAYAAARE